MSNIVDFNKFRQERIARQSDAAHEQRKRNLQGFGRAKRELPKRYPKFLVPELRAVVDRLLKNAGR